MWGINLGIMMKFHRLMNMLKIDNATNLQSTFQVLFI